MGRLVTLRAYSDLIPALVAASKLEAHGLFAVVVGREHASQAWYMAPCLGIRLQVIADDAQEARHLLSMDQEDIEKHTLDTYEACPFCGSNQVFRKPKLLPLLFGAIVGHFPFPLVSRKRLCRTCRKQWKTHLV